MATSVYPSDLSDDEWAVLSPLIPAAKPGGRPRSVDVRRILDGLFYVLRSSQWKLPHATPVGGPFSCYFIGFYSQKRGRKEAEFQGFCG
jgi:transposase